MRDEVKSLFPFNLLDLFGYLGQGYVVTLAGLALWNSRSTPPILEQLAALPFVTDYVVAIPLGIFVSYTVGHMIAHVSHPVLELFAANLLLGTPVGHALGAQRWSPLRRRAVKAITIGLGVSDYLRPFPHDLRDTLANRYRRTCGARFEATHYCLRSCFSFVLEHGSPATDRISTFLNLYSFSRNSSFALLVVGALCALSGHRVAVILSVACAVVAVVLFARYLRFFRLYVDEILLTFLVTSGKSMTTELAGGWRIWVRDEDHRLYEVLRVPDTPGPKPHEFLLDDAQRLALQSELAASQTLTVTDAEFVSIELLESGRVRLYGPSSVGEAPYYIRCGSFVAMVVDPTTPRI